jgi:Mn2+/Fe2+ NRAMP family transporter
MNEIMKDKLDRDQFLLDEAQKKGGGALIRIYVKLSGPGWLASAFTLGAGSMAGSLFLGVIGGYSLLWVQPLAMTLGVIMLGAISYVTLSIESSPFAAIRTKINPALAWSWLIGTILCNMAFSFPQFSVAYAALTENLFPGIIENADAKHPRLLVSLIILLIVVVVTFNYGGKRRGIKSYELIIKGLVALIVLCFMVVVIQLAVSGRLPWIQIASGMIPSWKNLIEPTRGFQQILSNIENLHARQYWSAEILKMQRNCMIGAASSTVAVNMCFLIPFSLLAKKWNRKFRGLALFDLGTGTLIPFILVTACIVIASASQFYTKVHEGIDLNPDGQFEVNKRIKDPKIITRVHGKIESIRHSIEKRQLAPGLENIRLEMAELQVASMLLPRDNYELAGSLSELFKHSLIVQKIFGIGVFAMTMSTISILMLISGFAVCEAVSVEHKGLMLRLGALCPAVGILWPYLWVGNSKAYLAVVMAAVAFTLLPIAYVTFFIIMNSKQLLGVYLPTGHRRVIWNILMIMALVISGGASLWTVWHKQLFGFPIGIVAIATFVALILLGHIYVKLKHHKEQKA